MVSVRAFLKALDDILQELGSEVYDINDKTVQIEQIPATVSLYCSEPALSCDTTERIRWMLHGEAKPIKSIHMDIFASC